MTNNTFNQFEQMVVAMEQRRQTLAKGTSERALFGNEFKIHFETLGKIYKMAVAQFGALAVEGCTPAKGTKLDLTTIYTSSVIDSAQVMKVTNGAHAKPFNDSWVQIRDTFRGLDVFTTTHLKEESEDEFSEVDGQLNVANLMAQSTICKVNVAEFCGARVCSRPF